MGFLARTAIHGIHGVLERGRSVIVGDFNDGPHFDSDYGRSFARTSELLGSAGYRNLYNERARNAKAAGVPEDTLRTLNRGEAILTSSSQAMQRPVRIKIEPGWLK